ncbi:MAG: hypothetical protein ACRD5W_12515 [Candidatus Acidiferrales bacterium]
MKSKSRREEEVARKLANMIYRSMVERFDPAEVDKRLDAIHEIASRIKVPGTSSRRGRTQGNRRRTPLSVVTRRKRARP